MIFNSFQFLWLFPLIFILYHGCSWVFKKRFHRTENSLLLLLSYLLYMQWNPAYTLILLWVTLCTFFSAIIIENKRAYGDKRYIITSGVLLTLLPLIVFKYYDFFISVFGDLFGFVGLQIGLPGLNYAIPIGLSFFTFQALGYLWDVYYGRIDAERCLPDYMLFVAFFPQIMSGPISRAQSLMPQIKAERQFNYEGAVQGLKWLLWGFFLKVVMADRLGLYVDTVYGNYQYYDGVTCFVASIFYSFRIYGDFAGYSLMAVGVARLLGFDLVNNFNRPYFSASITEFWRRWHISLSTWLRDFVYIPLGGSRCSRWRNYWNILVTFFVSGLWHGASWAFVLWGVIHGVLQVIEKVLGLQNCESKGLVRLLRVFATFMLVNFAWIFFCMPDLYSGVDVFKKIFTDFGGNLFFDFHTMLMGCCAMMAVLFKEAVEESGVAFSLFGNRHSFVRWTAYIVTVVAIMLFGVFDSSQFIYVSF